MEISGSGLNLEQVFQVAHQPQIKVKLSSEGRKKMRESRGYIEARIQAGDVMYGVNTGFGAFSSVRISDNEIEELQKNLIRSHSVGVGPLFSRAQTRAMMLLRANALARGHSGIRDVVVDKILEFLNHDILPAIPQQGSVGASGDLAPLSHLALALMGEGEILTEKGEAQPAQEILKKMNVAPLELKAKEGLSLINGCQVMTAIGLLDLYKAAQLLKLADIAGAMSLEALKGSRSAFDPLISETRPHLGESKTAANLRKILGASSEISLSHTACSRVQDAYSLRCMPAVHGATKDVWQHCRSVLEVEANSSTDNPLVFAQEDKILSCGNFHGMPVAFAMDYAGIVFSALASISECRTAKLINPAMNDGLPAFLTRQGGLNSGHMIVQVVAASLVSENKVLAHPASVDTIPTSAEKEDHVSMGTIAARKFSQILENATQVISLELLSASQGLDLLKPLKPTAGVERAYQVIRSQVPFAEKDRIFSFDQRLIRELISKNTIVNEVENEVGSLTI
ncbi:MAG: histidine ammonia-lyase [Bdellovibrionales bacterium]